MTRAELLKEFTTRFKNWDIEGPRLTAELLMERTLLIGREELYLNPNTKVPSKAEKTFRNMAKRVLANEPIQYVVGHCEFYGLPLAVASGVLIPRPETELIVDLAKRFVKAGACQAMDIGTGSGALALALMQQGVAGNMTAVDISGDALKIAAANAMHHGFQPANVDGDVLELMDIMPSTRFQRSSYDKSIRKEVIEEMWLIRSDVFSFKFKPAHHPLDLIVSNPPYVTEAEYEKLEPHIKDHEPRQALVGGEDGLDVHRHLTRRLKNWLKPGGIFLGEIGAGQGPAAVEIHASWSRHVELFKDYNGKHRVVAAWKDEEPD